MSEENIEISSHKAVVVARLQIASLLFDHIPSFAIETYMKLRFSASQLVSTHPPRKRVSFQMNLDKDLYTAIFGPFGKRKDLSRVPVPPEDAFGMFCLLQRQDHHTLTPSKASLQILWGRMSEEEHEVRFSDWMLFRNMNVASSKQIGLIINSTMN